jgi:hypothetical protein
MTDGTASLARSLERPERSPSYPWYDSMWLDQHRRAREVLAEVAPGRLAEFDKAMRVFRTPAAFRPVIMEPFAPAQMQAIRGAIAELPPEALERGDPVREEARIFRRYVLRDLDLFARLQRQVVARVAEAVGEPVEPNYNFLSLYTAAGVCPLHLDAPFAKWTLDLCVEQATPWPIHVSRVQAWEEFDSPAHFAPGWEERVKASPGLRFESHVLEPGEALVFSGTSQWHYRDPMPSHPGRGGATFLFMHFIPAGSAALAEPHRWAELFGVPALTAPGGGTSA